MESNITDQSTWISDSPLAEPHFDQEATLLSARPVVPIDQVSVKAGVSRVWLLGFGLAGVLLVAMSATALYYSRPAVTQSQPVPAVDTLSSGVEGLESDTADHNALDSGKVAQPDLQPPRMTTTARTSPSSTTSPNRSANPAANRPPDRAVAGDQAPAYDEAEDRDERRAARRAAKEEQRANRQRRRGKRGDDLRRIREIFEGPTRP